MKKSKILNFNIFILCFIFLLGLGLLFTGTSTPNNIVYAESEQFQIENDGTVISTELWVALYNVYVNTYNQKPNGDVLTVDMFKNFPISILNLSTNTQGQSYGLKNINGLGEFDLSSFTNINLSGNNLTSIEDNLKNLSTLKQLNLAGNNIGSFSTSQLSGSCLNTLEVLNLSRNYISNCDLTGLEVAVVDLSNNSLKDDNLILPQADLEINLNNNKFSTILTEKQNLIYGYQGAKNNDTFDKTTDILFVPHNNIGFTKIEVYESEELIQTITQHQKVTLPVGNYQLKFLDNDNLIKQNSINFKVLLPKVTAKLFINDKEVEFSSVLTQDAVIKFYGEDGAEIFVTSNFMDGYQNVAEYTINQKGTIVVTVYQTKDGYSSNVTSFYFTMKKSTITSWILVLVAIVCFIVLYFVMRWVLAKIIEKTSPNSEKARLKGKLD